MERASRPTVYDTFPIEPGDAKSGFRCGQRALDDFLSRHALANDRQGIGKTYVLRAAPGQGDGPSVLGFYTLSMADVESDAVGALVEGSLPRYPMPVALLGRLAVHRDMRGKGLGARLLRDALARVASVADQIGCLGVIVDAKDEPAERFYQKYGFANLTTGPWPRRLFLSLATLKGGWGR